MENIKILANYIPVTDKYVANISVNDNDYVIVKSNGADLSESIEREYKIKVEYNPSNRIFTIPKENRF